MTIGPGTLVNGKYRLGRQLGEGGMGAIFEARHEFLGTEVALKFLHPALSSRPNVVARFVQEARVSANIKSPHVVGVVDVDQSPEGLAFLVMELLHGEPLSSRLAREPVLPLPLTLQIALHVLLGLDAAHAMGVVHRDMKPENVFLTDAPGQPGATSDGLLVKILDFGIAKLRTLGEVRAQLTKPGMVMGTPEYMAPEQVFAADAVDARADLYALGAMMFEMLAGKRPVSGEDARTIAARVISGQMPRLDEVAPRVPREVADVVAISLASKPNDRFSSANAMLRAIANAAKEADVAIEAPPPERMTKKSVIPVKSSATLGAAGLGVAPQQMLGPGDPAAMAAFDARARGELPKALGVSQGANAAPAQAPAPAPAPAPNGNGAGGAKNEQRVALGTVAQPPDTPPPVQPPPQDATAFGAPSPYQPPPGVIPPVGVSAAAAEPPDRFDAGPGGTDAGMISPYATEGAWKPVTPPVPIDTTPSLQSRRGGGMPALAIVAMVVVLLGVVGVVIWATMGSNTSAPPPPAPAPAATKTAKTADDDDDQPQHKKKPKPTPTEETTQAATATTTAPKPTVTLPKPKPSTSTKPSASTSTKPVPSSSGSTKPPDIIEIPLPLPFP